MISFKDENIYDMALISKVKKQTGPKKIKNILKNLRNIAIEDVKEFSELKVKVLKEEKKPEIKIAAPIFGFQRFFEDFKNSNSKEIINNDAAYEGENTPSTVDDNEEEKQVDSSDFSDDE